ncbi:MAG: alpha/beta fold hydrolase [Elusimicrobia bacterium]|nr:alpha/beta fold hydrolase [Elusimicrobiota bacterium]
MLAAESLKKPDLVAGLRTMILESDPAGVCAALLAMAGRTDTTAALARLSMPSLVLVGEHDALTPPSAAEALAKGLPKSRLVRIPNAGHLSNLENAPAFNAAIADFLQTV